MSRNKIREISITNSEGKIPFFKISSGKYDFEGIDLLRKLLSNQKAKILSVVKNEKPKSIYEIAKKLKRNYKSVFADVKLLERFGFIELVEDEEKNRKILKPIIDAETITIHIKI